MARGWESKSVESQQEEKNARESERRDSQPLTPEERERRDRLSSLELSRARALEQLERATSQPHRAMLKRTLLALEREIAELETT
ncbi:MAG: hypothetical protein M3379_06250 [Acidobacteriota bacterium]|nr:hypothetical protein [Acidobacteriota bacterium]